MKKDKTRTIVICRMYAGTYITNKMGGEIINLLHDDNGDNYVYVNPYGYIDKQYDNTVEAVLLTRLLKDGCFEVLGVAKIGTDGQLVFPKGFKTEDKLKSSGEQLLEYEDKHPILYDGIRLSEIYKGQLNGSVTFKSDELLMPKKQVFITDSKNKKFKPDRNTFNCKDKRFPKQSLVSYITKKDNPKSFKSMIEMIEKSGIWDNTRKNKIKGNTIIDNHFNFLNVIKKEDDEIIYSNMFQYFFANHTELLIEFAEKVLNIKLSGDVVIEREKENIDLLIQDDANMIVIENKIKSGINGVSTRHDFSEDGLLQSQLQKYIDYAESEKQNKTTHYFIFLPDYNKVDISQYRGSSKYTEIKYSTIYNFFTKIPVDDKYYEDFVNSLYKQTKDRAFDYYEDMAYKFIQRIKTIQSKK